ncbi:MAG: alpha/beta fold hydrolase [Bacilli bacterium]|jgi:pimeloyl-ACP methyl ester carboxylesterase
MWWVIIGFGIVFLIQLAVFLILEFGFHRRSDNDRHLKYFTADDFDDIDAEAISFLSGKNTLNGFIYSPKGQTPSRLLVFCMGIGAGHHAYMHVIGTMAQHGYRVLAFDYTGAELSGGRYINGLPQALKDLKAAFDYIAKTESIKDLPVDVLGHSWGGYVSAIAPLINPKVRRTVSISAFNSVPTILVAVRPYMKIFEPFIDFANLIKFGRYGVMDVVGSIKKSAVPMLFLTGSKDPFVKPAAHFDKYRYAAIEKPQIEFILDSDKGHNPYLTQAGEAYFVKTIKEKKRYDKNPDSPESQAFYQSIDYELITRNDKTIFEAIFHFLDK